MDDEDDKEEEEDPPVVVALVELGRFAKDARPETATTSIATVLLIVPQLKE